MSAFLKQPADFVRRAGAKYHRPVHNGHGRRQRESLFKPVLCEDHGGPQLPVDLSECRQEVRSRDWIQLTGRLDRKGVG